MTATNMTNDEGFNFSKWWYRTSRTRLITLYLLPAFLVMGFITFYPLFYQVWMSFTDFGISNLKIGSDAPTNVVLCNYINIFAEDTAAGTPDWLCPNELLKDRTKNAPVSTDLSNFNMGKLLFFNLWWTFSNVIFHVSLGILIAVLLNQPGIWGKGVYRAIYVVPMLLPTLVIATVWRNMFDPTNGVINNTLAGIGSWFGADPANFAIRWMEDTKAPFSWFFPWQPLPLSYFALLITNIWLGWPFMTIVATGALQSIPSDLYEAASIDGATGQQQFWNITLPLLRPAMVPAAMLGIITTFNLFNLIFFTSAGGPLRQTEIMVTTAYRLVNEKRLYGKAAAFSVIIFFVLLLLTLLTNRITKATESYDA
jgi:arabinogalactan oligomer/maltooligosaccharide transport system permease protein